MSSSSTEPQEGEREFVCTAAPPPCHDPGGTAAWQRAEQMGAQINEPRRRERLERLEEVETDMERERHGGPEQRAAIRVMVDQAREQWLRDRKLALARDPVLRRRSKTPSRPSARAPRRTSSRERRPGTRRTARSASSSSSRSGDDPPSEEPEPAERGPSLAATVLVEGVRLAGGVSNREGLEDLHVRVGGYPEDLGWHLREADEAGLLEADEDIDWVRTVTA